MARPAVISKPEPLYIADAKDRLMNMLVDDMFCRIVSEVEKEEDEKRNTLETNNNPTI